MAAPPPSEDPAAPGRWVRACRSTALDAGGPVPLVVAGRHLLLMRDGEAVHATERACPHEGADLARGRCAAGKLFCPRHLAWFDLRAGTVSPGWSFRALRLYLVDQSLDELWITIDPT